ncbi:MAG: 2-C-methyl-D-erythritol 4-phosphate cytidylyltransferase [Ruminococcaceae bacterium]|nr:2-C-methyl-D-erythritol 4-phosphate cytidylyltransferase [Oscillospiraceae bacterium]
MNIALLIAGGIGQRMNMNTPKQFILVNGKPVIIYTLEAFQKNKNIDEIAVVCLKDWVDDLKSWAQKYGITKLTTVVEGGSTGMESLRRGMYALSEKYDDEDIIVIHDAVRPLISEKIIDDNIEGVKKYGNAITVLPSNSALLYSEDKVSSNRVVDRDLIANTQTPQSLRLGKFREIHLEAIEKGIEDTVATCTLLVELGNTVYFVDGDEMNFKITTAEHIDLLKAYLNMRDE